MTFIPKKSPRTWHRKPRRAAPRAAALALGAALALAVALLAPACGAAFPGGGLGGKVAVVSAENFWGSIAAQVGGGRVDVVSVISSPTVDPHAYEPTARDARTIARADYVIVTGAGYDPWMTSLLDAQPSSSRRVLDVAGLAGRRQGDNPHTWYSPTVVERVVDRVARDLEAIDPPGAATIAAQARAYTSTGLHRYDALRASIRTRYAGVPVGATESLVVDLARDLRLDLVSPAGYMTAISEGGDPATSDKSTFDAQIAAHRIAVLIFNRQNSTTDVQALVDRARAAGIPVVAFTETLDPTGATFQDWQSAELDALQAALARATGR